MGRDHFLPVLRALRRRKGYAALNVAGLAVGLACAALTALYVFDELSYDRFHEHADRLVRVVEDQRGGDRVSRLASTSAPVAAALEADLAGVAHAARVYPASHLVRRDAARMFQEDGLLFVDSTFFDLFSFPLLRGDAAEALDAPFSLVLTEATARRYFSESDPLGQTLTVRDGEAAFDFTVTGVVEGPPANTHLTFDLLASYSSLRTMSPWMSDDQHTWDWPPMYVYALLAPGADRTALETRLPALEAKWMGGGRAAERDLGLQLVTDIHLRSGRENELTPGSDVATVALFGLVAVFILLLACINYVNLATARAMDRAREVGVRKAVGAQRGQLVGQFLGEAAVMVGLAAGLALGLVALLLPLFNAVAGKALPLAALGQGMMPLILLAMVAGVALLAGAYPAFYLTRFRPTRALQGAVTTQGKAATRVREGLVAFQFAVTIALLIGTAVVYRQLDYLRDQRLGFDKEHVLVVPLRDQGDQINHETLKRAWARLPGVEHVAASSGMPGEPRGLHDFTVRPAGAADSLTLMTLTVDADFAETFGLEIVAGRDFSEDFPADATDAFLLNESAARRLGWTEPVGERLTLYYWLDREYAKEGAVIGVVRDFQVGSLRRAIDPTVLHILPASYYYDYLSVRLRPGPVRPVLDALAREWARFNPDRPFEFTFLDQQFDALYRTEVRLGTLVGAFALLAVFIACLGLLGLAAYTAERRTKEIGVRKVLGAGAGSLVALLAKDFLRLVLVGFALAAPIAYVVTSRWLDGFAYRIALGPGLFLMAGGLTVVIALLTVSGHALRVASADPVKALRYE